MFICVLLHIGPLGDFFYSTANVGDYNPAEHQAGYSLDFLKLLYSTTDHLPSRYELSLIELHKQHQ